LKSPYSFLNYLVFEV